MEGGGVGGGGGGRGCKFIWGPQRMIMKVCVQLNSVYGWEDFLLQWVSNLEPLDHAGQCLPYCSGRISNLQLYVFQLGNTSCQRDQIAIANSISSFRDKTNGLFKSS